MADSNRIVRRLAQALGDRKWDRAVRLLREEMAVRRENTPDAVITVPDKLIRKLELAEWDARIAGAGASDFVWVLGRRTL